jgi:hypothetical protein
MMSERRTNLVRQVRDVLDGLLLRVRETFAKKAKKSETPCIRGIWGDIPAQVRTLALYKKQDWSQQVSNDGNPLTTYQLCD